MNVFNILQIVFGGSRKAQFIAHEILKHGSAVPANGTMCFIGYDQIKISGGEQILILVIHQERLNRRYHHFRFSPVVAMLFVDHGFVVVLEVAGEGFPRLVFQFDSIHQEKYALCISCA